MFLDPTKFKEPPPVEVKHLTPAQRVLLDAAKYIEKYGWTQGGFFSQPHSDLDKRPACAWGAIGSVAEWEDKLTTKAYMLLYRHLGCKGGCGVPKWNDTPGRTKEQVVAALRGAAQCF